MRPTFVRPLVAAAALVLAASHAPATAADDARRVVRTASSGFGLPEGARLVGTVSAPAGAVDGGLPVDLGSVFSEIGGGLPKAPPLPCLAKQAWARSGTALTGYLYTWVDAQTGVTEADVVWWTDDGDYDPEDDEGLVAFASADCATRLVVDWSITDVSNSVCPDYPVVDGGALDDETAGPFREPVYYIFGVGWVPYFRLDATLSTAPCLRTQSTVIFKAKAWYVEKNRGSRVLIGCVQRSWPVTFAPTAGDDLARPEPSWLTVGAASAEQACVSGW